jgi:hypothetical protein
VVLTMTSSKPDMRTLVAGESVTFTATGIRRGLVRGPLSSGTMVFTDTYYPISVATPITSELARAQIMDGQASFTTVNLAAGTHLITATHEASGASVTLVQTVHSSLVVTIQQVADAAQKRTFFAAPTRQSRHR